MKVDVLLSNNQGWATHTLANDPEFFNRMSTSQHPDILWIGCSDSRVPPNSILDLPPGKLFVLRNIANQASQADTSYLSVLEYAIEILRIPSIVVCGHSDCGGIKAVLADNFTDSVKKWLAPLRQLALQHHKELSELEAGPRALRLCELNVRHQASNILNSAVVQAALQRGQKVTVDALLYDVGQGLLREIKLDDEGKGKVNLTPAQ